MTGDPAGSGQQPDGEPGRDGAEPASGALRIPILPGRDGGGLVLTVRVLPAAYLILAVNLLLCAARLGRGWWWQDDLNLLAGAAGRGLSPDLLFSDYNGHLVPGTWVVAWLFDRVAPLQWWPAAVVILAFVAAVDLSALALFRRLFGTRPAILVPFAMVCATSLTLTSTLWWAAALQWLPITLSLSAGLWFHVGYLQTGRIRDAAGAVACVVLGLAFFEKALTTLLVLAVFTVLYGVSGPAWTRPWRAIRDHFGYWLAHAAVAGSFLGLYLARVHVDTGPSPSGSDVVTTIRWMLLDTFLPSLAGGPLRWYTTPDTTINAWPHPLPFVAIGAWALTALAILGSLLTRRGAWRAWSLLTVFLAVSVGLVVKARLGFIGPFIGRDHRYLTDAAVLAPLCLALAWMRLAPGLDQGMPAGAPAPSEPDGPDAPRVGGPDGPAPAAESENLFQPHVAPRTQPLALGGEQVVRASARPDERAHEPGAADQPPARTRNPGDLRVEDALEQAARQGAVQAGSLVRRLARDQRTMALAGALAVVVVTAGGALSGESFIRSWTANPTKPYLENLQQGIADAPEPLNLLPESTVPDLVMTPTFEDDRQLSQVTLPLRERPNFPAYAGSYSLVDGQGRVHPADVLGEAGLTLPGFTCAVPGRNAIVFFAAPQAEWRWVVKLGYLAAHDTDATLSLGTYPPVPLRLRSGLHTVYVDLLGGGSAQLVLASTTPGSRVCIGSAVIGKQLTATR